MNPRKTTIAILAALSVSLALADDFKTNNGKEYKDATVTQVESDGIVVKTKSGISKLYFQELAKEVRQRFNYDPQQAAAYSAQQNAAIQKSSERLGKEQAAIQSTAQQQQDAGSLRFQLQTLQQEKYNMMEQIRQLEAAPERVEAGRNSRGRIVYAPNPVKADLPVLKDRVRDLNRIIGGVKDSTAPNGGGILDQRLTRNIGK
jgi:hypothetical protein